MYLYVYCVFAVSPVSKYGFLSIHELISVLSLLYRYGVVCRLLGSLASGVICISVSLIVLTVGTFTVGLALSILKFLAISFDLPVLSSSHHILMV